MANPNNPNSGEQRPFAEFLREAPRHQGETVTLAGHVAQSDKEGHFVLDLGGGQTVELPTGAVRSYKVEEGRRVQLEVDRSKIQSLKPVFADKPVHADKPLWSDLHTHTILDQLKHTHKDPIYDPIFTPQFPPGPDPTQLGQIAGGAVPFTLAAGHQAPQNAVAMQALTGQVAKPVFQDVRTVASLDLGTVKEITLDTVKEVPYDTLKEVGKDPIHDTVKEVAKDPIFDTVKEVYETLVEGGGTIQEGGGGGTIAEGGGFPGGGINQGGF